MANQGENKNRNHITTGVSFKFIHCMTDLLERDGAKWITFALSFQYNYFY